MDSEKKVYAADTYVFWDIVDFKVDEDEDEIDSFHTDLEFSLLREGHNGAMIIIAYGHAERSSLLGLESLHPHIQLKRQSTKFARLNHMLLDMVSCVHINRTENFMLIMKGMAEEDAEVVRVIKELQQRDRHVILVVDDSEELCAYPSEVLSSCTVWLWKDLLHGERPIRRPLNTSEDNDDDDDDDDDDDEDDDDEDDDDDDDDDDDHVYVPKRGDAGPGRTVSLDDGSSITIYCNY